MIRLALVSTLLLTGCSLVDADIIKALSTSDRSWCVSVTSVYGTVKMGGSGVAHGKMLCNGEGWSIENGLGGGSAGMLVIPAQPRILLQQAPTYQEVDPSALRPAPRGLIAPK